MPALFRLLLVLGLTNVSSQECLPCAVFNEVCLAAASQLLADLSPSERDVFQAKFNSDGGCGSLSTEQCAEVLDFLAQKTREDKKLAVLQSACSEYLDTFVPIQQKNEIDDGLWAREYDDEITKTSIETDESWWEEAVLGCCMTLGISALLLLLFFVLGWFPQTRPGKFAEAFRKLRERHAPKAKDY